MIQSQLEQSQRGSVLSTGSDSSSGDRLCRDGGGSGLPGYYSFHFGLELNIIRSLYNSEKTQDAPTVTTTTTILCSRTTGTLHARRQ